MKIENFILERYNKNELIKAGYYLRIRGKEGNREIKVYYHGIQMLQYKDNELTINPAVFVPNSKNVYTKNPRTYIETYDTMPKYVKEDATKIEKYFQFKIGNTKKQIAFKFAERTYRLSKDNQTKLLKKVQESFKDRKVEFGCNEKRGDRNRFIVYLDDNNIKFEKLYSFVIELLKITYAKELKNLNLEESESVRKERFFQTANIYAKCILKDNVVNYNNEDFISMFEDIENTVSRRINTYINYHSEYEEQINTDDKTKVMDYLYTKTDTNQEKQMQQDFMCILNQKDKDRITYTDKYGIEKELYSKECYPFELEYTIYAGKVKKDKENENIIIIDDFNKRSQKNIKGRIDNVLVNGNTLNLVEIKYGTSVIGNSNGIHKHLMDLYSCLNISKQEIIEEFTKYIEERNLAINKNINVKLDNLVYDIICIYNDDCKEKDKANLSKIAVIEKINEIYQQKVSEVKDLNIEKWTDSKNDCNKYYSGLKEDNIDALKNRLLNKEINCPVRIILVDHKFTLDKFEEYKPKEKELS